MKMDQSFSFGTCLFPAKSSNSIFCVRLPGDKPAVFPLFSDGPTFSIGVPVCQRMTVRLLQGFLLRSSCLWYQYHGDFTHNVELNGVSHSPAGLKTHEQSKGHAETMGSGGHHLIIQM